MFEVRSRGRTLVGMNTTSIRRSALATAAAGALVLGSAAGVSAAPKGPKHRPAPQNNDRVVSVSIHGHAPIDLAKVTATSALSLRAKVWDPNRDGQARTVAVTLGVFTKRVGGTKVQLGGVAAPDSASVPLALRAGHEQRKVKGYVGSAVLASVWTPEQVGALKTALKPGDKAFVCISTLTVDPAAKYAHIVNKRLGLAKGKAVRDCVRVTDSTPE